MKPFLRGEGVHVLFVYFTGEWGGLRVSRSSTTRLRDPLRMFLKGVGGTKNICFIFALAVDGTIFVGYFCDK